MNPIKVKKKIQSFINNIKTNASSRKQKLKNEITYNFTKNQKKSTSYCHTYDVVTVTGVGPNCELVGLEGRVNPGVTVLCTNHEKPVKI